MKKGKSNLDAALQALELDYRIIPLQPNGLDPLIEDWDAYMYINSKKEEVIDWLKKWPNANIGILCGLPFGIVVVETNFYSGPAPTLERELRSPCVVTTPDKVHFYYQSGLRSSFGELPRGINVYGFGYYVPIPPFRVDGLSFDYLHGSLADARLSEPPRSILKKLQAIDRKKQKQQDDAIRGKYKETRLF